MRKKYALVTGASGGIGSAIAEQLLEQGFGLYLHYFQNKPSVEKLLHKYKNSEICLVQADLSSPNGPMNLMNQLHHPVEQLIVTSGNSYVGLITEMDEQTINDMVQLHITSPFLLARAVLPAMITNKRGNIVFVTSVWGEVGASCEVLYSMLKGGQNTFVKALAKEVAPSNIRVNAVSPGAVNTSMLHSFNEDDLRQLAEEIPMGRLGEPVEIANAVLFLLSDKASYINGQIISVNGAWHT